MATDSSETKKLLEKEVIQQKKPRIFVNRFLILAIFLLVIQQLIGASSTLWISDLGAALISGNEFAHFLGLFAGSWLLANLIGIGGSTYLEKAKNKAIKSYTKQFSKAHECIPDLAEDKTLGAARKSWLTKQGETTISDAYSIGYDSLALGLNGSLNIAALAYAVDIRLLLGYGLSLATIPLMLKFFNKRLDDSAKGSQNSKNELDQVVIAHAWENSVIGNKYNLKLWFRKYKHAWNNFNSSSVRAVLLSQSSSLLGMIMAAIPAAASITWVLFTTSDKIIYATIVATLYKQIQILQYIQNFSSNAINLKMISARLPAFFETTQRPEYTIDVERIHWENLNFTLNETLINVESYNSFLERVLRLPNGRVTLRGPNKAGKTTLIKKIKTENRENAYYLPTDIPLTFDSLIAGNASSGEARLKILAEATLNSKEKILLLDEWEANLDDDNREVLSKRINEIAAHKLVIEIRHSKDSAEPKMQVGNIGAPALVAGFNNHKNAAAANSVTITIADDNQKTLENTLTQNKAAVSINL